MHSLGFGDYLESDIAEAVSLPFNGCTRFVAILPKDGHQASDVARTISSGDFKKLNIARYTDVKLDIPRFSASSSHPELIEVFEKLGITDSTTPDKMGVNTIKELQAIQKADIRIDEEGATLASASDITGVDIATPPAYETRQLTFNRPFLFFVENTATGTILMAGLINNL